MGVAELADAIVTDVPAEEVVTLTSPESPRMKAMAAIEESRRQELETELDGTIDREAADDAPIETTPEAQPENKEPEAIAPAKFRVKVDGVEMEVDQDELIRTYQKNAAADHRLEEAARILREAQLAAQTAAVQQPEPEPEAPVVDLRKETAEVFAKLYEGDQDAAAEALANLLNKQKGGDRPTQPVVQSVDEGQLTQRVLEQIAINQAFEKVKTDYPEILSSPRLENLAVMEIDQRVANGEPRSQAMLAVCDEIYKEFGKGRPQPEEKLVSKREQNKARLDTVPTASAAAVTPKSETQDVSSVIAQMAARRLGQTMPKPTD